MGIIKNKYINKKYVNFDIIWQNQESFWYILTGSFPSLGKRYHSIFREDTNASCRYSWYNNRLYFIDNAGFNGKISFNILQAACIIYKTSILEAARKLLDNEIVDFKVSNKQINNNIIIKFIYEIWTQDNYFTNNYGLSPYYLNSKETFNVRQYWTNTRSDKRLLSNRFINPVKNTSIAYYFDSKNVKLYFPDQEFKWYANTNNDDIYNFNSIGNYQNNNLFITASGKDTYCLEYYFNTNVVGLQSESIKNFPIKLLNELKYFNNIYLIFDNDKAGIKYTKYLYYKLKNNFNVKPIYHTIKNYDISDYIKNNKTTYLNERIKNYIK